MAFIAESTSSSRMPSARRRSTMRARVRSDVMPLPLIRPAPPSVPIARIPSTIEPCRDTCHLVPIGQIDLQRRDRYVMAPDRMEIGAFAGIRSRARRTDPVHRLTARTLHPDHVLGLVAASQPRDPVPPQLRALDVGHVHVEQPRPCGLAPMPFE